MNRLILVDTREQKPIEYENTKIMKLEVGDYTTPELLNKSHIERKSGQDLYGSLHNGKNHTRFRKEIVRAQKKGIKLSIFVECPKETYIAKRFPFGWRLKTKPAALRKTISTMETKYNLEFIFCENREDFINKSLMWFDRELKLWQK